MKIAMVADVFQLVQWHPQASIPQPCYDLFSHTTVSHVVACLLDIVL